MSKNTEAWQVIREEKEQWNLGQCGNVMEIPGKYTANVFSRKMNFTVIQLVSLLDKRRVDFLSSHKEARCIFKAKAAEQKGQSQNRALYWL